MKKKEKKQKICGNCVHLYACGSWNIGSLFNADAEHCVNYETGNELGLAVRCRDCKYFVRGNGEPNACANELILASNGRLFPEEDFFCAYEVNE